MADEILEFETRGAAEAADALKDVAKQAKEAAKAQEEAEKKAQKVAQAQSKRLETTRNALLGVAGAIAIVVKRGAEAVDTFARIDAVNGRLKFALKKTSDAGHDVAGAFKEAQAQFKEWEKFGVTAEEQTKALTLLANESQNYQQSLADVKLALDIAAASGWEMERATEAVRKVRQGEVEVLKELGVLSKQEAETLGKTATEANRAAIGIGKLRDNFGGGAGGTVGLDASLKEANAKLETTEKLLGEILAELGDDATGLIAKMGEFTGILDEGEHPLDALNERLGVLRDHAKNGDWEKLAGVLLLGNPATVPAGLALLGASSSEGGVATDNRNFADFQARARARGRAAAQAEEDEQAAFFGFVGPEQGETKKGTRKKKRGPVNLDEGAFDFEKAARERELRNEEHQRKMELAHSVRLSNEKAATEKRLKEEAAELKRLEAIHKGTQEAIGKAALEGGIGLVQSFVKGEGAKAAISGAIEAARATAAYAGGNIPGGIAHTAASIQFFAVAAQAGKGGGKKATAAAGASAAGSAQDREQTALVKERFNSNALADRGSYTININTAFPPEPNQARQLADALQSEMRNRA